ncbi:adenylate/guanylate cyclase domain-containing protein [Mycetocola sp. JXN-3]|uniref:adenylate/guanylate cyclase domain-containing protein n=1 Tax=Mycetocola sp. JXN-3 TaxID=2116510 RepID=UPI00165D2049|nr:adenylate/guanylate cyclase domain-containing protein [Mycetocola sp. JXN-3]
MVSVFLDLTGFTSRTFWEDSKDMAILANAVLGGFTDIVQSFGGHVLGLRGDGLFAGFGPVSSAHKNTDVVLAAAACNKALEDVRKSLNPQLENRGIEAVKVRAGLDFGTHTFTRTGTRESNEVNVVGFASNFAAKCEKLAASWEIVVGEEFADRIADKKLLSAEGKRPKSFTSKGQTKLYSYFGYRSPVKPEQFRSVIEELNGRALDEVFS